MKSYNSIIHPDVAKVLLVSHSDKPQVFPNNLKPYVYGQAAVGNHLYVAVDYRYVSEVSQFLGLLK